MAHASAKSSRLRKTGMIACVRVRVRARARVRVRVRATWLRKTGIIACVSSPMLRKSGLGLGLG